MADTYVTENIAEDTIWPVSGSPYIVPNDVQVYQGVTLTIEKGTEVRFDVGASLIIGGELIARGEDQELIKFTSNEPVPSAGSWKGIEFMNTATFAQFNPGLQPTFKYDYSSSSRSETTQEKRSKYGFSNNFNDIAKKVECNDFKCLRQNEQFLGVWLGKTANHALFPRYCNNVEVLSILP
jgi:hypothetical protein